MQTCEYILTVACEDARGIVAEVTGFIMEIDGFIVEASQFGDAETGRFFQRICFAGGATTPDFTGIHSAFSERVAKKFNMNFHLYDVAKRSKLLLMVSGYDHCLNDLLYRHRRGALAVDIPAVVSNHDTLRELVEWHGIPFYHFPLEKGKKAEQEARVIELIEKESIDLVALARYMQILSPELSERLVGRAINIHHSFLPSFKGAKPYHQAHARGVKLIGATAHYVTSDLDEGPIIEQEVVRVNHTHSANDFVTMGKDIESRVLSRAVKYHIEHRVLMNDSKTIVFNG